MEKTNGGFLRPIIKSLLTAVIATLIGVIAFAIIINFTYLSSGTIKIVNQFIKTISIFLGCFISISGEKGLIKGIIIGIIYSVLTNLIFFVLGANISIGIGVVVDIIFCAVIGGILGIICVNVKNK